MGPRLGKENGLVAGFAQDSLNHRGRVVAPTVRVAEGTNCSAGQRLEPSSVLDELGVRGCLVDDGPAEQVRAAVVSDLTAICLQSSEVLRVEEHPAFGSKPSLVEAEVIRQLATHRQASFIRHRGDQVEELRERPGAPPIGVEGRSHATDAGASA
jgi:hypothetical protein